LTRRSPPLTAATHPASATTVSHDPPTTRTAATQPTCGGKTHILSARRPRQPAEPPQPRSCVAVVQTTGQPRSPKQPVSTHSKSNSQSERPRDAATASFLHPIGSKIGNTPSAHLRRPPPTITQSSRAARPLTRRSPPPHPASSPTFSHDPPTTRTAATHNMQRKTRTSCPRDVRDSPNTTAAASLCDRHSVRTARQRRSRKTTEPHNNRSASTSERTTAGCCGRLLSSSQRKPYRQHTTSAHLRGLHQPKRKAAKPRAP
jgi:hypothetical protein